METGVVTPKSHRWRICPQSEASTTSNAARDSSVPSEMFQTTLSRLNARKLPTTPLPLMDKVVARFMNISPEQWERVNSAIEFLNDHFKDVFLSWLTIRWLVASHPEQFLPAPYNSYELLAHESETKLAIENAKKGAGRWRESYHGLQPETKAWQNKLNKVEAEMACLTLAANGGSAHNTAMARNTTVRRSEALQPGAMAVSKDCEIGPLHIPCRRPAKSQRSKGTATQRQESASGQVSTEAESDQCLFHKDIDTKQKKRLSTKPTQHPSTHDEQELSSKRFNHPIHNSAEQYTGDTNSFNVSNMRSNGSSSNTCTMTTTTKTTTTTSYATVSTNERKDRHSVSADSVGLNMQEGTGVQNGDDPAVMVEKPSTVQVLNRVQDILRCVRGVRSEDDRQTLPFVAPCGSGETDSARTSTSGPNVEVLYVQYNQQKGRRDRARDLSGLAANPPNASRSPMLCQQDRSVQKPSTKSSRTGGFSVTAVDRLLELKQTGSITEYANRFMNQFSKATDIPEAVAVGVFLENLLPDFRTLTVGKRPETLADAIRLAYQVEQAILEKQDRLPGCGDAFGVAIHLQDPPAVAGRCVQPGVGDTVDNSHSSRCDVDTSIRPRSQTARTHCQTSSGHYHNVSYHEAASLKELSEGVSPTGSSVCLNSNSSDEVMGDEETLRLPATSDSRTTPVMRRSTIGGGEANTFGRERDNFLNKQAMPHICGLVSLSGAVCLLQIKLMRNRNSVRRFVRFESGELN
ncbi:UNVERIFIED_CONTAM: hypothetical protein HHA_211280 [Hammondia hammondi]|eukprot:XP_008885322.1 hypothetical protein HHA_211280 [Hammondia hammondi]